MISPKLKSVVLRVLRLDDFDLRDETTAAEVPGWDSLTHVAILAAVEEAYGVRFRSMEVLRLKSVGDLQALVDRKTAAPK
jgi:acyl carrier protein